MKHVEVSLHLHKLLCVVKREGASSIQHTCHGCTTKFAMEGFLDFFDASPSAKPLHLHEFLDCRVWQHEAYRPLAAIDLFFKAFWIGQLMDGRNKTENLLHNHLYGALIQ